jgi:hypothetical protein
LKSRTKGAMRKMAEFCASRAQLPVRGQQKSNDRVSGTRRTPACLCRSGERCTVRVHAFLRLPPPSLGVLQPWPLPSSRLVSPRNQAANERIPWLRTTCRSAAASPRTIPRHAGAHINQAGGYAAIWGGTLGVRRDVESAREGELSVPHRRGCVCSIDHIVTNGPTATTYAWCSTCLENPRCEQTSRASRRSLSVIPLFGASCSGGAL